MKVQFTRDSVAGIDARNEHHLRVVNVDESISLPEFLVQVLEANYLEDIGAQVTWSVHSGRPLAVISGEWSAPKLFLENPPPVKDLDEKDRGVPTLFFQYHGLRNPHEVFETLRVSVPR